ncbi:MULTISPECIES: sugar ABC transporter substrate-binding protein [Streptosporangium]|uniref:Simple sugar transport system substrate-binding protein/ribose transport system substrate-binding protein n=1 Tax=Streptosporangium brasiliense TaxID=47480 RepID=A0ABT9R7Y5_9ACTN|nr:sugar ABC transporter substrate-binding protein [Streptosporangium brasiliense]MDP9865350.1 simple sugar transport system substrate-binding protein/ribose transport system substrate-binding protein [Streptosporangium brasiliense]
MKLGTAATGAALLGLALTISACGSSETAGAGSSAKPAADAGAKGGKVGIDFPRADSDFWNSYNKYVPQLAAELGVDLMPPTNSQNDVAKLVANTQAMIGQGAKAVVMAPQDTGAIASTLQTLESKNIPVVSVDTRPDKGKVFMVVRADNKAYGTKACEFLGEKLGGKGKVVQLMGALSSINGRDRAEAFGACMKEKFPGITVFEEPTEWDGTKAASMLQTRLQQHPDIKGIYMHAGGVHLAPTLQVLKAKGLIAPPEDPKHVFVISNDGIPQEFEAIRKGEIDATLSQPADLYAKYALFYAKAAIEGKTFQPGPTDHDSTIIQLPNGLEDQLPAPLVTKENVDDKNLWGNQVK